MNSQVVYNTRFPANQYRNTRLNESLPISVHPSQSTSLEHRSIQDGNKPIRSNRDAESYVYAPSDGRLRTGHMAKGVGDHGQGLSYNDRSEHMLRRKTPNGTLAAGYSGEGRASLKQVVLPAIQPSVGQQTPHHPNSAHYHTIHSFPALPTWKPKLGSSYEPVRADDPDLQLNTDLSRWAHLPSLSNVNQLAQARKGIGSNYSFRSHSKMPIPTVLQPAFQPTPGPTASSDGGLYGPYWPDGGFVPYRPAAIREAGGYSGSHVLGRNPPMEYQPRDQHQNWYGHISKFGVDTPPRDSYTFAIPFTDDLARGDRQSQNLQGGLQSTSADTTQFMGPDECHALAAQNRNGTGGMHFQDKTLSWAHGKYMDLLAYLHHNQTVRQGRFATGSKAQGRNSMFPRPPRQSYTPSQKPLDDTSVPFKQHSSYSESLAGDRHGSLFLIKPSHTEHLVSDPSSGWSIKDKNSFKLPADSSQDVPHYKSSFQPSHHHPDMPFIKARQALEMLATLCEQSDWSWVDGMLLGGCLAYGLEDYHKALDWYSKIIEVDPKHVEAISNLAATLLCLNRREEAEQYWLQSVKLRPNYFEAVEHLIGLLCGDHRGHEAVGIIEFVEHSLRLPKLQNEMLVFSSKTSSNVDCESWENLSAENIASHYEHDASWRSNSSHGLECKSSQVAFGSSGFAIPDSENGRILALIHAKGNMLYALGHTDKAAKAFEDAVMISAGTQLHGIQSLIRRITEVLSLDGYTTQVNDLKLPPSSSSSSPLLLPPDKALKTASLVFGTSGNLPGLRYVTEGVARRAAISTTSNSLLSLAKIFQDTMSSGNSPRKITVMPSGVGDILALYYLSLSLQPSPSTANNVGILLASVQQPVSSRAVPQSHMPSQPSIPGVVPGSGVALALAYYNYGLNLDSKHAHLYTNLGSLLKDIGQLTAAIKMYEQAVACDSTFDIALANLANAVKDQGRTSDAIEYYRRAVASNPDFAEAVCGLANALNSVCDWTGRGGVLLDGGKHDRWHVDDFGMVTEAKLKSSGSGWIKRVVDIVGKQLRGGSQWGIGTLHDSLVPQFVRQIEAADSGGNWSSEKRTSMYTAIHAWMGHRWEGTRITRLIERSVKRGTYRWYHDKYTRNLSLPPASYPRPHVPSNLTTPSAPTVLPFHTFTCPLSAKDIRMISQRNALRISCSTLRAPWMQGSIFPPPSPPNPHLHVGYVSSDFNNHPLAHLMQSVFGLHNPAHVKAFCYALTPSDHSVHRQQIEREAPVFRDVSNWSAERLVQQIVHDGIHILVNLNGYTRGARNEVFAARPAPIQMSFMGFAGSLGAEWCDYLLADEIAVPPDTLRPWRRNVDLEDQLVDEQAFEDDNWIYSENVIFCRDTFFCCDHAQSEPQDGQASWEEEQTKRWQMRKELFPSLSDDAVILGNFNQLYKIEPTTFRTWLRILDKVPKAILWLLRFPDLGEGNLKRTARDWAGESVASRIWFTDVAPKHQHISRARVCDLFLDTPECNAHTTAADVLWSSTPLLTLPRYKYKMCSRMAASILRGALPRSEDGRIAASELIAEDDDQYEEFAIQLANDLRYQILPSGCGQGTGRLAELRRLLYNNRWTCALFDTRRWVRDLETAYGEAWRRWVNDEGGDIYL